MSLTSQRKGYRIEHELETKLNTYGIQAKRIPLSGATSFMKGDIMLTFDDVKLIGEVKARKDGFARLYKQVKEGNFYMINDEQEDYVLTDLPGFIRLYKGKTIATEIANVKLTPNIRKWLSKADILFLKANYKEFLVIFPERLFGIISCKGVGKDVI